MAVTKITGAGLGLPNADGNALGGASNEWSDLYLADGGTIQFGNDQDVTLTHVADAGLLLNTTMYLTFRDAALKIYSSTDGQLDIDADTEVEITATTVDLNGNLDVSGTYTGAGLMTTGGNIVIPNDGNIGSVGDTDSIAIDSSGNIIASQNLTVTGNFTVNGTTTTVATTNMVVKDNMIELNNGAGSNANDSGIVIERGSTGDNAIIMWDESADKFQVGTTTSTGSSTAAVYCTKSIVLETASTSLDVRLTSNVRSTSKVKMYYRIIGSEDDTTIDKISWTPFNTDGSEDITVTPAENDTSFKEYKDFLYS